MHFTRMISLFLFSFSLLQLFYSPAKGQNMRYISFDSSNDRGNQPPTSPCPQTFQYQYGSDGWTGLISVPPPDIMDAELRKVRPVKLEVRLRVSGMLPSKYVGKLELAEKKEVVWQKVTMGLSNRPILYRLHFPTTSSLPHLNMIKMNGNLICSGSLDSIHGRILTSITLEHTFYPSANVLSNPSEFDNEENLNRRQNPYLQNINPSPANFPQNQNAGGRPIDTRNIFNPVGANFGSQPVRVYQPAASGINFGGENTDETELHIASDLPRENKPVMQKPKPTTFFASFLQGQDSNCGKPLAGHLLVVKGEPVTKRGDWPWIVAIFESINVGVGIQFHCSGSLISRYYVLTAAHCTKSRDEELTPDKLIVYLGRFNLNKWAEPGSQTREVKQIFVHPNYGANGGFESDMAVLELSSPAEYNPYVQPACIWPWKMSDEATDYSDLAPLIGRLGTVVGWGKDENGNKVTAKPRLANLPIVSQEECLRSGRGFAYLTSNRTFCAGFRNGTGPCNGDSGAGLMVPVSDDEGGSGRKGNVRWFLRGVVSLTLRDTKNGTCDLQNYVVFTDVAKFGEWILKFIEQDVVYAPLQVQRNAPTEPNWLQPIPFRSLQSSQDE